ncbi:GNAT family N-acetyltransferase [Endozoicomonas sp. SM1973]|uniref:GNAT family N-acetyltransferase n=1 Tax=Spartinivicinus marinus TaxID=2994442 RepID=A0A853IDW1_9GAMM|nr:GNAT family N-acetyltransferase [Spartinivicinus marinus]MCX4025936.1 GNAT family N-acetyltransferase [Spartinivicinus marinus]NYZ68121.1 GNAT family N-acetyltransferase [Spartinivicinus marinus]
MSQQDFDGFWPTFKHIVTEQETYAFEPAISKQQAYELWCLQPLETHVAIEAKAMVALNDSEKAETVLGSYYLKPNAAGPSSHICNCGYMVTLQARGQGIAKLLCIHSQERALALGFKAMQFNSVVSTNEVAVKLWQMLGFSIIGTVPKGYLHKKQGFVDTYIMYKWLT